MPTDLSTLTSDPAFQALWKDRLASNTPATRLGSIYKTNKFAQDAGVVQPGYSVTTGDGDSPTVQKNPSHWIDKIGQAIGFAGLGGAAAFGLPAIGGALGGGGGAAGSAAGSGAAATGAGTAATTGGILSKLGGIGGILGKVGPIAAQTAFSRGQGRLAENDALMQRDQLAQNQAAGNAQLDSTRLRQAILLKLLGGVQDAQVTPPAHIASRMPQLSGGLRPSAIQGREEILAAMLPRIMESLFSGQHLPELSDMPESNWFDTLLSGLGTAGGFAGALGLGQPKAPAPSPGVPSAQLTRGGLLPGLRNRRILAE